MSNATQPANGQLERSHPRGSCWRFTVPAALLLLAGGPAHGYELLARLGEVFPRAAKSPERGAFYRLLRGLEADGAVTSQWATPESGPARRVYELTDAGRGQLDGWACAIEAEIESMRDFLAAYERTRAARVRRPRRGR